MLSNLAVRIAATVRSNAAFLVVLSAMSLLVALSAWDNWPPFGVFAAARSADEANDGAHRSRWGNDETVWIFDIETGQAQARVGGKRFIYTLSAGDGAAVECADGASIYVKDGAGDRFYAYPLARCPQ